MIEGKSYNEFFYGVGEKATEVVITGLTNAGQEAAYLGMARAVVDPDVEDAVILYIPGITLQHLLTPARERANAAATPLD